MNGADAVSLLASTLVVVEVDVVVNARAQFVHGRERVPVEVLVLRSSGVDDAMRGLNSELQRKSSPGCSQGDILPADPRVGLLGVYFPWGSSGAVLRRYIEPDAFDNHTIGEAVYALAMAFSEDGTLSDPRRPASPGSEVFDVMLEQAAVSWGRGSDRSVESTAREAGVAPEAACLLFPSLADLADSVVWSRVLGGGSLIENNEVERTIGFGPSTEMAMIFGLMRRLRDVVESLAGAVDIVRSEQPVVGIGIRTQLEREVAEVLRCHCPGVAPRVTAVELVGSAFAGHDGWLAVTSLMRVLDANPA